MEEASENSVHILWTYICTHTSYQCSLCKNNLKAYSETAEVTADTNGLKEAVKWTYYGNDATRTNAVATYGTKFAADNWMHKVMGIQLGLTDSARCQLPAGYDGTGYWSLTVYALGYTDTTIDFEATDANIVKIKAPVSDTSKLSAAIAAADALNEADYTAESWAAMKLEYEEAVDALAVAEYQADIDEATEHLTAAINASVMLPDSSEPEGVPASTFTNALIAAVRCSVASSISA